MAKVFSLRIELGNDAMQTQADVADVLKEVSPFCRGRCSERSHPRRQRKHGRLVFHDPH